MIRIDGSYGEGGGQIIRTSVSLAAITRQPVEIVNIRAKRSKPGLQPQHLAAVKAAAEICGAQLEGANVGSTRLVFSPTTDVQSGDYRFEIGTAGSAPLVAQTVLIPLALTGKPSTVVVTGGTHNPMAPDSDYLERVYASALTEMGISVRVESPRAGFYPAGGGLVAVQITGAPELFPIQRTQRGAQRKLEAIVTTSGLSDSLFNRARAVLLEKLGDIDIRHDEKESNGPGAAVTIIADHVGGQAGFTGLGARIKPMEAVTQEAIDFYLDWRDADSAVDEHLADQLVLPALFAAGESSWKTAVVTEHLRSVLWLGKHFVEFEYEIGDLVSVRRK
jgi:RNA 3'-terminal phosphate cyclase (ATP)